MSTIFLDCPTDGMTISPPFCIRGGMLTSHAPVTITCQILCPGSPPLIFRQTVSPTKRSSTQGQVQDPTDLPTPFCFKITAAPECVVSIAVLLSFVGMEEVSVTVHDVSIVPSGGSDCQCPADCPVASPVMTSSGG